MPTGSYLIARDIWVSLLSKKADIDMQGVQVCRGGLAASFPEDDLKIKLDDRECQQPVYDSRPVTAGSRF